MVTASETSGFMPRSAEAKIRMTVSQMLQKLTAASLTLQLDS